MYRMIIVDDEFFTLEGMKVILDWSEYNIEIVGTALSGSEGIRLAEELKPDIILTDIKMRAMDGISMIEHLRTQGLQAEFIIMSGYKVFEYAQRAMEAGVISYLLKPINKNRLIQSIQKSVERLERYQAAEADEAPKSKMMGEVLRYINQHYCEDITLQQIAGIFFVNIGYLSRRFKEEVGESYISYVTRRRMERAKLLLEDKSLSISEIAAQLSYKDINYFSSLFKKTTGVSPQKYRRSVHI